MKFLLAVDGSENSLRAAQYAAALMENLSGSAVSIIFVDTLAIQIRMKGGAMPVNYPEMMNAQLKDTLQKAETIFSDKKLAYNVKVLEGYDVAETICDYAKEYGYDQIIMGTRGLGNVRGIVLGSVSHKVIHLAPCTVTFVK